MYRQFDLTGKTALVVGGHGGVGKAIALGMAESEADVCVASCSLSSLQASRFAGTWAMAPWLAALPKSTKTI